MNRWWAAGLLLAMLSACAPPASDKPRRDGFGDSLLRIVPPTASPGHFRPVQTGVELLVLGVAQDAGFPQLRCQKACCRGVDTLAAPIHVVSLGLIDARQDRRWLFEASPDLVDQIRMLDSLSAPRGIERFLDGIFLTHAHIGHYTGLMYLGREAMGARAVPVYAMPRMEAFLRENGPWDQLVTLENIELRQLRADSVVELADSLAVVPVRVPHRDEYSETVGYRIHGPRASALFIPDIDKWAKWERDIAEEIAAVDYALLDATFFAEGEIPGRDMSEIPHPFVQESMAQLDDLPLVDKQKVYFIHFNHTNPLLQPDSEARRQVEAAGFRVARQGMGFRL
ncbi:MAG: MBL fold metallo-hydrolase [Bacteroidota bacterium]